MCCCDFGLGLGATTQKIGAVPGASSKIEKKKQKRDRHTVINQPESVVGDCRLPFVGCCVGFLAPDLADASYVQSRTKARLPAACRTPCDVLRVPRPVRLGTLTASTRSRAPAQRPLAMHDWPIFDIHPKLDRGACFGPQGVEAWGCPGGLFERLGYGCCVTRMASRLLQSNWGRRGC